MWPAAQRCTQSGAPRSPWGACYGHSSAVTDADKEVVLQVYDHDRLSRGPCNAN